MSGSRQTKGVGLARVLMWRIVLSLLGIAFIVYGGAHLALGVFGETATAVVTGIRRQRAHCSLLSLIKCRKGDSRVAISKLTPRLPQPVQLSAPAAPPSLRRAPIAQETLLSWLKEMARAGVRTLPSMYKQLTIKLGIVAAVNFIFWPLKTYTLPDPLGSLVMLIVFLTATYNDVIPKTIYWVIVFTFGTRLFKKIRTDGLAVALQPIRQLVPEVKQAYHALGEQAQVLLLTGGGVGLIVANYFASYSRFGGARNKFDKYFVVLVISFAVSYILGESKRGWLFKFGRLAASDLARVLKRPFSYSDEYTFLLLSGFVGGLLLDAPLIVMRLMYGGYILGALALVGAIALPRIRRAQQPS